MVETFPPYINPDEVLAMAIGLFAREPGLPQKLLKLAESYAGPNKVAPFFDYLFTPVSEPAEPEAKYRTVGYRLRDIVHSPSPAMIEAGADKLLAIAEHGGSAQVAAEIYRIMEEVRRTELQE